LTWPSTEPNFWQTLQHSPRQSVPRTRSARPARSAPAPMPRRELMPAPLPAVVEGLVTRLGEAIQGTSPSMPMRFGLDALDKSLLDIRAGKALCFLRIGHDGPPLGANSCFCIWRDGAKIRLQITHPRVVRDLIALRRRGLVELSIGATAVVADRLGDGRGNGIVLIERANIYEVALVGAAACRGCRLFFIGR
jgi:hypothetical protein